MLSSDRVLWSERRVGGGPGNGGFRHVGTVAGILGNDKKKIKMVLQWKLLLCPRLCSGHFLHYFNTLETDFKLWIV